MFPLTSKMRPIHYPLDRTQKPSAITPNEPITDLTLDWPTTDSNERISVQFELSLNEYIALASSIDVGRDIAYGDDSMKIWWIWVRSVNTMSFCTQVDDCINNNVSTQVALNNTLLSNGVVNPDQIQPISPQMDNRFPVILRQTDAAPPPPSCDKDALWAGILEIVTRLDSMGLDFLEQTVANNDKAERITNIIDIVPLFGDVVADVITVFADNAQDIENAYVAHSSLQVLEETACALFELVCEECRYPTFDEIYDYYASYGISGIQDIASYGITAAMDYLIGTNGLGNAVVWYTMNSTVLYTLYLGGTWLGKRGTKWLEIYADIGEDAPNNGWELLCDGCEGDWCHTFDFSIDQYDWLITHGTWTLGVGFVSADYGGSLGSMLTITRTFGFDVNITKTLLVYNIQNMSVQNQHRSIWTPSPDLQISGAQGSHSIEQEFVTTATAHTFALQDSQTAPVSTWTSIKIWGTGNNPFGVDNCI